MLSWVLCVLVYAQARILVYQPQALANELAMKYSSHEIPASLATFGNPPYGTAMKGKVYKPKEEDTLACSHMDPITFSSDSALVPFVLLERGQCTFVTKVRNAQRIGAAAVLIGNNDEEASERIVMADDGTGGDIFVPSFFISKSDEDLLDSYIDPSSLEEVVLSLTFEINTKDRVDYQFWTSSEHEVGRKFLHDFAPYASLFSSVNAWMTPHYVLWYATERQANDFTEPHEDCVSGGRYCAPDPDDDQPLTGRHVVMEDLRELCVYQQTVAAGTQTLWWNYVQIFYERCSLQDFATETCSEEAMEEAGASVDEVRNCVASSFEGLDYELADNTLLREERRLMTNSGAYYYPMMLINNQTYRGDLEAPEVFNAICTGMTVKPPVCIP